MGAASLAYIVVETGDIPAWDRFLTNTIGLASATSCDSSANHTHGGHADSRSYRMDDASWRVRVQSGEAERLAGAGLEFRSVLELESCVERIRAGGGVAIEDATLGQQRGFSLLYQATDPSGTPLELVLGRVLGYELFISPAGVSGFVTGEQGEMGLGHVVLPAPDIETSKQFWLETVGLGLTDTMSFVLDPATGPQKLYFMHADNARHHSVALFEAPSPTGIIHVMLEARTIDDVGRFIDRCDRDGVHIISQFGRHSNDRMLSIYVMTPGGFMLEFGCDGLQIDWRNWVPTTSLAPDLWGHKFMGGPPGAIAI